MMFRTLEDIIIATAEMVRPPERLTVSEAAEKYRVVNNPGAYVGPWLNDTTPYLVEPMDELSSTEFTGMIFVGPAQTGKTDMVLNWVAHTACCDPADMMIVQTSQSAGRDFAKRRVERLMRHSPEVGARVLPGRNNQNTFDTRFTSGWMLTLSWPTINELSGKPVQRLWLTDYDRMPQNVDGEGSPYDLAKKRTTSFRRNGMTVAESSPGYIIDNPKWKPSTPHEAPPTSGILALYNRGDRRRWYWRCPHCEEAFEPDFHLLRWPENLPAMSAAEAAYMACPNCGGVIEHETDHETGVPGKHAMNSHHAKWLKEGQTWQRNGAITGEAIRSDIASFWMKGVVAAFADWRTLVFNYLMAMAEYESTGSQEALKTTVNTDQGLPYMMRGAEMDRLPEDFKGRARDLGDRVVPEGVRFLIATIDVQKARFVVQVQGFGVGGDVTIVDRFDIRKSKRLDDDGDPFTLNPGAYLEDWYVLQELVLEKTYPLSDGSGRVMQIRATACDSGGREGVTKNAYDFWRWLRDNHGEHHRRFQLVKGSSIKSAPRVHITYPDSDRRDRHAGARGEVPVLFINSDLVKDQVSAKLDRTDPAGGMVEFPDWLPDWFYNELTAERRTAKGWENPRAARNEAWDLLVYAEAICLSRLVRIEQLDWQDPPSFAAPWDDNDLVAATAETKRFVTPTKTDYNLSELAEALA